MTSNNGIRLDHQIISRIIEPESRVLDLGCGNGATVEHLGTDRGLTAVGVDPSALLLAQGLRMFRVIPNLRVFELS